jgi:putative transposase
MSRVRVYIPGISVHAIQRGNNRRRIFDEEEDYEIFLSILAAASARNGLSVHGYALMTTHFHLITTPRDVRALPRTMQAVGVRYVLYYNRKYTRVGTLWNGRYRALPIGDEKYWLTCLRYIEQNPVRAQMVDEPQAYRWSSYCVHALGTPEDWLEPHDVYLSLGQNVEDRQAAYRALCADPVKDRQLVQQRLGGRPLRKHVELGTSAQI